MLKYIFCLLCYGSSMTLQAQSVTGYVVSAADKSPVQFASIALLQLPDSSIVTGVITDMSGKYTFENVKKGNFFVKASYVGLNPGGTRVNVNGSSVTGADTIFLSGSSHQLGEVVVTGDRLRGTELIDRTVYSVPSEVANSSANGYELLKKIPQVQVDFQNNITLNGSSNFIIQVDGKQRDKEFLARLMPSDVKSIEIINNPSGKYEGNIDGVINIILKKEARFGLSGSVGAFARPNRKPTGVGTASLDYGMGKITFYATSYAFYQGLNNKSDNLSRFIPVDSAVNLSGKGGFKVSAVSVNTGFDYYMTDKDNLSFNINFRPMSVKNNLNNNAFIQAQSAFNMTSFTNNNTSSDEGSTSLFYKRSFKKPVQEFTNEATFYLFRSEEVVDLANQIFRIDAIVPQDSSRNESTVNERSYFSDKINYVQPIGDNLKLEGGYQLYYQLMNYDFTSELTQFSNQFQYSEFRNSVYAGISLNLKKFGFQTNMRLEHTNQLVNKSDRSGYYVWLPSVNIQYKFTALQNIKLTYNRRINRPSVYDLNPYQRITSTMSMNEGNQNLKPEYRNRMQLTYTVNFGKNNLAPNIYYEKITDKISPKITLEPTSKQNGFISLSRPENLQSGYETGAGINGTVLFMYLNARVFKGRFDEYINGPTKIPARDYSSYSMTGYLFKEFKKTKLTTFFFMNYNGVTVNAEIKTYSAPMYGFGAQQNLGDHSFGLFYLLPFSNYVVLSKTITDTRQLYSENKMSFDVSYYIQLQYTYKFNKGKTVKKLKRDAQVESDTKNEGIK